MKLELRVALISSDAQVNQDLKKILEQELAAAKDEEFSLKVYATLPSVEDAVIHYSPHLIIINIEPQQKNEKLTFLDSLVRISSRIPIIVTAWTLEADLMLLCVKKGARDFLKQPFEQTEIKDMLARQLRESPLNAQERQLGVTFSFFSYKGGVGTTFLSCNTAVSLARNTGSRVLLWDMVLQNGDVPFLFDYEPKATLTDLIENAGKIDEPFLRGTLPIHPSGVAILAGPRKPEDAEIIRNDQIQTLHHTLRRYFDYIVVDAGHNLTDHIIGLMDNSKFILLTTDLHLPGLKNTLRCLEVFERLGYGEGKFKILLNRYNSKYEKLELPKVGEILHHPIAFAIDNDYQTVSRCLNAGIPVADLDKDTLLAKHLDKLAGLLVSNFEVEKQKPSLFSALRRLFSKKKENKSSGDQDRVPKEAVSHAA